MTPASGAIFFLDYDPVVVEALFAGPASVLLQAKLFSGDAEVQVLGTVVTASSASIPLAVLLSPSDVLSSALQGGDNFTVQVHDALFPEQISASSAAFSVRGMSFGIHSLLFLTWCMRAMLCVLLYDFLIACHLLRIQV